MKIVKNTIFPDDGKMLYRKEDGAGPFHAVRLWFKVNENGIVVSDSAESYEDKELTEKTN